MNDKERRELASDESDKLNRQDEDSHSEGGNAHVRTLESGADEAMDAILRDPWRKGALIQTMGLDDQ